MENTLILFEKLLLENKEKAKDILEDLAFNLLQKHRQNRQLDNEILLNFLSVLKKIGLFDNENLTRLIRVFMKLSIKAEEDKLYQYIGESELLKAKINQQKNILKNEISRSFYDIKTMLEASSFKNELENSINDAFLFEIEALEILKETAESAFITTLENGQDIEFMANEITKHLLYSTLNETDYKKERILKSAQIILTCAFELANESKIFAKELCFGAIKGVRDGIILGLEKFKQSFAYCKLEEDLSLKEKELIDIENDFINMLRMECKRLDNPAKDIIQNLLDNELDTLFAKLKRLANESKEQLTLMLNELRKNPKIDDFNKIAQSKIASFKKELNSLEILNSQKYKELNTSEAKKLGKNLWQKAKNLLKK